MRCGVARDVGGTGDLARSVDAIGLTGRATKSAKVDGNAGGVGPEGRVHGASACIGRTGNLTETVDAVRLTACAAECPESIAVALLLVHKAA